MEGIISQYDDDFSGILFDERGSAVVIPGALKGEKVRYHIEHKSPHQNKAWARCTALLEASPLRVTPPCPLSWPVAGACAGCPLMHMAPNLQIELKKQSVINALKNAGIAYLHSIPCHAAPQNLRYRNRTDLVLAEHFGKLVLGSYKYRSHEIVPVRACPILRAPLNPVLGHILRMAEACGIPCAKDVRQISGAIRYVSVFANDQQKVLIDLVCKSAEGHPPIWLESFANTLMKFAPVAGVSYSINDSPNNAIRVAPSQTIVGLERLPEHHANVTSYFSAAGFTQLNTQIAAQVYTAATQWLQEKPRILWDLYCGAGAFGRSFQPKALYGAEFSASAIKAAQFAAQKDPFKTQFNVIDLEKSWPNWPNPDVLLLDPPRKGLSKLVIDKIRALKPPTLLYMSCNPKTFAQNAAQLSDLYVIQRIEAFDMMPQTAHLETLALLKLR